VTVIDCSALDALAYFFDVVSRNNTRISSEQGNPALLVRRRTGSNDAVVAMIKMMPFPLHNREFVNLLVCCSDVNGDFLSVGLPTDEVIDYGMKTNSVRGFSRTITRLAPEGHERCKVMYHMHLDAGGRIPSFVVNAKLPLALGAVDDLREEFQRDDEIDKLERDQLARVIKEESQTYTAEENILINKVNVKLGMLEWERFEELESPDHLVKMGGFFIEVDSHLITRASTIVDASAEECAAWEMSKMSRDSVRNHRGFGGRERHHICRNEHHGVFHAVYDIGIPGFQFREIVQSAVWKMHGDRLIVTSSAADHAEFPRNSMYARMQGEGLLEYERVVTDAGDIEHTKVTWTQHMDLGGSIPKFVVNSGAVGQLMYLSAMRKRFDKSLEVDREVRAQNVALIAGHADEYSLEERFLLNGGVLLFELFEVLNEKALEMASPLTTAKIAYKSGDLYAWGLSTTTVRASPEEILAFMWDARRRSARREDDLEKSVDEWINGHNTLIYTKKRSPNDYIADRDFLGRVVWKKEGDGFVLVTSPEESEVRPITDSVVRAKYPSAMRIKRKSDKETTLEYVIRPDAGGLVPSFIFNRFMGSSLAFVTEIQQYFQDLRGLEEWDADDARAMGEALCIKTQAEKHNEKGESKKGARVRELFTKQKALKQIGRKHEFFQSMITRVVENKLRTAGDVKSKLCSVNAKEGREIGAGLALALATNLTAEAGVDEWILKYQCLGELDRTEAWFR